MTFQEWQRTCLGTGPLTDTEAPTHAGQIGRAYRAGFLLIREGIFAVPLPGGEAEFATLIEAERYLWRMWCDGEINNENL